MGFWLESNELERPVKPEIRIHSNDLTIPLEQIRGMSKIGQTNGFWSGGRNLTIHEHPVGPAHAPGKSLYRGGDRESGFEFPSREGF